MSEFLKETDKLLGKAVKSINDNIFTDADKDANEQEEEKESPASQKKIEETTPKKAKPSTTERLKPIKEYKEPTIFDELKSDYMEAGENLLRWLLTSKKGLILSGSIVTFILLWLFAGFWWAVAVVVLCLAVWVAKIILF